ncbi:hypothetical protein Slin15195_G035260 [Septoria linicola]|uniref:Uncharacterized protein n=1 Tax=Septoria linicola TaxID=215465 RepID=A0A9Q9EHQ7_9PEZI|nr:hypothetical protein Slin14017_G034280 [Septoria linicola]USW50207.1 hypothetical protein Slin15195_G035260 [Septoria linicola]
MAQTAASLLTIPCELRNAIYMHIFEPELSDLKPDLPAQQDALARSLQVPAESSCYIANRTASQLDVLRVCKQIHNEAHLLALSMTPFHVSGDATYPDLFDIRSRPLSPAKIGAIKHLTLTARISHLRPLNEAWAGLPFGHPSLSLDTLTIIPKRPEVDAGALAEIADLSQSHTLAYILGETLRGLRNVKCIEVINDKCFNEVVWRLFYRSLVYKLWRWGGYKCGIRFENGDRLPAGTTVEANRWFRAYLADDEERGFECGDEVLRLVGVSGELPDPNMAGVGP